MGMGACLGCIASKNDVARALWSFQTPVGLLMFNQNTVISKNELLKKDVKEVFHYI